jgi:hypothetical protein
MKHVTRNKTLIFYSHQLLSEKKRRRRESHNAGKVKTVGLVIFLTGC